MSSPVRVTVVRPKPDHATWARLVGHILGTFAATGVLMLILGRLTELDPGYWDTLLGLWAAKIVLNQPPRYLSWTEPSK